MPSQPGQRGRAHAILPALPSSPNVSGRKVLRLVHSTSDVAQLLALLSSETLRNVHNLYGIVDKVSITDAPFISMFAFFIFCSFWRRRRRRKRLPSEAHGEATHREVAGEAQEDGC